MDLQEQRSFIRFLAKEWKECYRELMVYRHLAHTLERAGVVGVQALLDQARNSPKLARHVDEQFATLDALIPPADPSRSEKEKELLAKWKPKSQLPN